MALNKHQIFATNDLKEKLIEMPEWGGSVKIRALSVKEQLDYDAYIATEPKEIDMALQLIMFACVDDNNNKLFNKDDIELLKQKSSKNLFKLVHEILDLNKQNPKNQEDLLKN